MPKITQDLRIPGDPSYIGYSKPTGGDRSTAAAVRGIGNLFTQGATEANEFIKEGITEEVQKGNVEATEDILGLVSQSEQGVADGAEAEEVDIFSEVKLRSSGNPEINKNTVTAEKLTQAYKQGKITPTYYWGQMSNLSKQLKTRYPGHTQFIDRQFQGITGQVPANALAAAKRKEYTDHLAKVNLEEKHFQSLIKQKWVQGHLPSDYWERVKAGAPYDKLEIYETIQRRAAVDAELARDKLVLSVRKAKGEEVKDTAIGEAQKRVNIITSSVLNNTFSQDLINEITTATQNAATGRLPSSEEKQALRSQFALLKAKIKQQQLSALNEADPSGETYHSLIDDPAKMSAILKQGQAELDVLEDLLTNDEFGLFAATLNNIKAREQDAKSEILKKPIYQMLAGIRDTVGSEIFAQMNFSPDIRLRLQEGNQALIENINARTASGEEYPLKQKFTDVAKDVKGGKDQRQEVNRRIIRDSVTALTSDKATQTSMTTAASDMFGQGNRNFLAHFSSSPKHQRDIYDQMVSPVVTRAMQKVRDVKPELWDSYRDWSKEAFVALQLGAISSIQEGALERPNVSVVWDDQSNQFKATLGGKQRGEGLIDSFEKELDNTVLSSVSDLNRQIKLLENILKVDGEDVAKELTILLGAAGINLNVEKKPTIFHKAREALQKKMDEEEGEKKNP